jgi:N-acetylmuramic acid 6-phosphate etherase
MGLADAAELPPTFGIEPERVQAILAGGAQALDRAVEGAEDDGDAARAELRRRGLGPGDAVVAISASGRTPFAIAALEEASAVGARRIAVTCDPDSPLAAAAEIAIAPVVGPEVIAGSTRMKGGLAQKMVLHLLSTTTMVKLGRVEGNLMTHLRPGSRKLRGRAARLVAALAGIDESAAARLLEEHGSVRAAVAAARAAR